MRMGLNVIQFTSLAVSSLPFLQASANFASWSVLQACVSIVWRPCAFSLAAFLFFWRTLEMAVM